jgi:predicted ATPase
LYKDGILISEEDNTQWPWDNTVWAKLLQDSTDDVVDLSVWKIEKLPKVCWLQVLPTLACLGTELDKFLLFKFID